MSKSTDYLGSHVQSPSTASAAETMIGGETPSSSRFTAVASTPQGSGFGTKAGNSIPPVIPPDHPNRTLVLCFDGTGDQFDADNSNIVQLFSMLKKDDQSKQMVYYQAGIGTYTSPQIATPGAAKLSKTLDMMIAWNLDAHVMDGYEFLMQNYTAGDRICIFGFSRGAYTARALAGMIHKVGLLPACNHQQVPFAYRMYTLPDEVGWKQSNAFKRAFSIDVDIEFVGVWDTVNSVGLIPRRLPFTTSNTIVRTFRHAVSLDERRAKFKANLWNRPNAQEATLGIHPADVSNSVGTAATTGTVKMAATTTGAGPSVLMQAKKPLVHHQSSLHELEAMHSRARDTPTDIEEVWFSGCHCDVGGGSVDNASPNNLARIPLRWMIREIFKTNPGILFNTDRLRETGLDPATIYPVVLPRPPPLPVGSTRIQAIPSDSTEVALKAADFDIPKEAIDTEEEEELKDAMCPIYDQLSLKWGWWVLEILPSRQRYQKGDNTWETYIGFNLGQPRFIPKQKTRGFKVHRSVKMRMEAEYEDQPGVKYKPKPLFAVEPTWVD